MCRVVPFSSEAPERQPADTGRRERRDREGEPRRVPVGVQQEHGDDPGRREPRDERREPDDEPSRELALGPVPIGARPGRDTTTAGSPASSSFASIVVRIESPERYPGGTSATTIENDSDL